LLRAQWLTAYDACIVYSMSLRIKKRMHFVLTDASVTYKLKV